MGLSSLLAIASKHEFPIISIDFLLAFTQADISFGVLMVVPLGMGVDVNRVEWVLKFKNHFMYSINQVQIGLIF